MLRVFANIDRLKFETQRCRRYEGFIRDLSERTVEDGTELCAFLRQRYYSPVASNALLLIQAVEDALIAYVARCWGQRNLLDCTKKHDPDPEDASIPLVHNSLKKSISQSNFGDVIDLSHNQALLAAVARNGKDNTVARVKQCAEDWITKVDETWGKEKLSIQRLLILRHELIGHAIEQGHSSAARKLKGDKSEITQIYPEIGEVLRVAEFTGALIDQLQSLYLTSHSSNPDKFATHDGDQYWSHLIRGIDPR